MLIMMLMMAMVMMTMMMIMMMMMMMIMTMMMMMISDRTIIQINDGVLSAVPFPTACLQLMVSSSKKQSAMAMTLVMVGWWLTTATIIINTIIATATINSIATVTTIKIKIIISESQCPGLRTQPTANSAAVHLLPPLLWSLDGCRTALGCRHPHLYSLASHSRDTSR